MAMAAAPLELVRLQSHPQQQQQQPQQEHQEQEMLWKQLFSDMSQWWDFRRSKSSPRYPDFRHKQSKLPLWLNSRHKPGWVDARLAALDAAAAAAGPGPPPPPLSSPSAAAGELELCHKLCAQGRLREAVDAAAQLVQQRGCRLPSTLLYRLLKRCRQDNAYGGGLGLAMGRRVHALAAASGLRGDAFLATQLMGLYGAHGQLEDAMAAFEEVAAPDAYNWATITFAFAAGRRGGGAEAERAVQLYRRMCEQSPDVEPDDRVYAAVLKACGAARDLRTGRQVHARMVAAGRQLGAFAVSGLVSMYAKCGSVEEARRVLEQAQAAGERGGAGVEAWNALMAGYAQQGMGHEAVRLYTEMTEMQRRDGGGGCSPNAVTFVCALQACAGMGPGGLEHGKRLHADLCERGREGGGGGWFLSSFRDEDGVVLGGSLVNMYAKCGSVEDARGVFDLIPGAKKNVVTWTALIAGHARHGMGRDALDLYKRMSSSSSTTTTLAAPDSVTYVCLLQACAGVGALDEGRRLHREICQQRLLLQHPPGTTKTAGVLGGSLVNMYAKCGSLEEARRVLDELPDAERNVVAWTAMVAGYAQHGRGQDALDLYKRMVEQGGGGLAAADSVTYMCLLQACASVGVDALDVGRRLHAQIEEVVVADEMVAARVVNMYVKCGHVNDARRVLDELRKVVVPKEKLAASTNVMIAGYAQHGMGDQALALYYDNHNMDDDDDSGLALDAFSAASLLQACAGMGPAGLIHGHRLRAHAQRLGLLDTDAVVGASLVNMLAKCGGSMDEARAAWDALPEAARRDGVAWTSMVAGYARHGMARHAVALYDELERGGGASTDPVTCVCLLHACASVGVEALDVGRRLHAQVAAAAEGWDADTAVVVGCSLVNMYAKCGHVNDARAVFDRMRRRNVVTWNAMLGGYAKQGMGREALALYHTMTTQQQEAVVAPDAVTYVCALQACASVGAAALDDGRRLHAQIEQQQLLDDDDVVAASVVNMYAKCGDLAEARRVLDGTGGVVAWTALMAGYAQAGAPHQALALYARMRRDHPRLAPTAVTYTCVLQACAAVAAHELGQQVHAEIEEGLVCVPHPPNLLPHRQGAPRHAEGDSVSAALVHMYANCGDMAAAHAVFTSTTTAPAAAWGALLCGYARHGDAPAGLALLRRMRAQGVAPDAVTFLAALTLCAHAGLVDRGRAILASMQADYGLAPAKEHVTCVVDMLGRAGRLHEAMAVASSAAAAGAAAAGAAATNTTTSSTTGPATWHALLGACGKWGDVETGRRALAMAEAAGQADAAAYVLMANVYAGAGDAKAAQAVRARVRLPLVGVVGGEEEAGGGGGAEDGGKPPGESWWTDPESGLVHTFRAGG